MQPSLYAGPFNEDDYYAVPLSWLAADFKVARVDTCDLLLFHTYDGEVIFDEEMPENWPQQDDHRAHLRAFFSRSAYSKYKNSLMIDDGLLRDFDRRTLRLGKTKRAQKELTAGIKYVWTQWPPTEPWLYRPRAYLLQRWPAWLGQPDPSSRLVIVALLALTYGQTKPAVPAQPVLVAWSQIYDYVTTLFDAGVDLASLARKLRKGLDELRYLGLVEPGDGDETWHFDPTRLAETPAWPVDQLAQALRLDRGRHRPLLDVVRELMLVCCEPVTRLKKVRNTIQQDYRAWVFTNVEIRALHDHIRSQRFDARFLTSKEILDDFVRKAAKQGQPIVGPSFSLRTTSTALVEEDTDGKLLMMPVKTAHGLNATQIRVKCDYPPAVSLDDLAATLADLHFYIWQEADDAIVTLIPLPIPPPTAARIQDGFTISANRLHTQLDYNRPFQVLIRSTEPDSRLRLDCTVRVLRHRPPTRVAAKTTEPG